MKKAILLLSIYFFATGLLNVSQAQTFQWLTRMGGPDPDPNFGPDEWVRDIEVDADGNVYACGRIRSIANFDGVPVTTYGFYDLFICKYDCHGNLVWVKTAGGGFDDIAYALALDQFGHIYFTGQFCSTTNLPCTFFDTTFTTNRDDMFLAKLDTSGNYLWGKFARSGIGTGLSRGFNVVLDNAGNPNVLFGAYPGQLFPGWNTTEPNLAPYISRFDTSGIMESLFTPSADFSTGTFLYSMDSQDNYIINGHFDGDSALVGNQTLYNPKPGFYTMYVSKFSNAGILQWIYMFDDTTSIINASLTNGTITDSADNIYVTGDASPSLKCGNYVFTDPIPPLAISPFIIKLTPQGQPVWATQAYTQYQGFNKGGVALKTNGYLNFSGTYNTKAVFGSDTLMGSMAGSLDLFIAEVDPNGNMLGAVKLGCTGGYDVDSYVTKVDANDNVYIAGNFEGTLTAGTHSVQSAGGYSDGFIAKYGYNCTTGMSPDLTAATAAGISVWPNPVARGAAVTFATAITDGNYSVINIMGMEVATGRFQKGKGAISTQTLAAGVYTVMIQGQSNMGKARLVVVE